MALARRKNIKPATPAATPAATMTDIVAVGDAHSRRRVRIAGQVTRMAARPRAGHPVLVVHITDDTGTATAVFSGRRSIGGVTLGRHIAIEGVPLRHGDRLEFTNPAYTLLPRP